mmetsp:Transcript_21958/g.87158  ORF Transcript_21958/g.87158 Transcript_21958/m.87158 type:complete len:221 (+) Transcript_21958:774-1436(+)
MDRSSPTPRRCIGRRPRSPRTATRRCARRKTPWRTSTPSSTSSPRSTASTRRACAPRTTPSNLTITSNPRSGSSAPRIKSSGRRASSPSSISTACRSMTCAASRRRPSRFAFRRHRRRKRSKTGRRPPRRSRRRRRPRTNSCRPSSGGSTWILSAVRTGGSLWSGRSCSRRRQNTATRTGASRPSSSPSATRGPGRRPTLDLRKNRTRTALPRCCAASSR